MMIWSYDHTRCGLLDRTCKALVRKLWGGRVSRAGKRVQPIDGRTRNPRVLLYRLRFACCFGKLGQHNNARRARTKAEGAAPKTYENRAKIDQKSVGNHRKNRAKSTKNRWKIDLGRFWASKPGSGTRRGAFGTRLGRAQAGSRAILGRPGLAKSGRETSKSEPGTSPLNQVAPGPGF